MRFPSILLAIFCIVLTTSLLARVAAENTNSKIKRKQGAFENRPQFLVEPNNADFPDVQVASRKLRSGWSDAVRLAAYACVLIHEDHPAYRRYFEPGHAAFVKGLPFVCDIEDIKMGEMHGAELFTSMTIIAGKSSALTDADREMQEDATYQATLYQDLESGYDIGDTDDTSIVEVTRRAFDYPSLKVITENRGCDALGAKDSGLMTSFGALLLHEFVHWRLLTRFADTQDLGFDTLIRHTVTIDQDTDETEDRDWIDDYKGEEYPEKHLDPDDGYGPQHAHQLVVNEEGDSFRNADNYRWCAVDIFWTWFCGREFEQQDDNDMGDKIIPEGSNGQVPYPGEQFPEPPPEKVVPADGRLGRH